MPFGVEATSPFEDQGVCLALATTATDDEIPAASYGTGRSSGMPVVRQGSGGLPSLILRLPLSPISVAGDWRRPPRGDLGGSILAVSRRGTFRREVEWQTIFATLWSLWIHRNEVIFRGHTPSADAILHSARGFASFWHRGGLGPSTIGPL